MKEEETSKQIIKRADGYVAGYANGLKNGNITLSRFTYKEDMKAEFEASPKILLEIEQFTDEQMRAIAEDISERLIDGYWDALREAVERELNR